MILFTNYNEKKKEIRVTVVLDELRKDWIHHTPVAGEIPIFASGSVLASSVSNSNHNNFSQKSILHETHKPLDEPQTPLDDRFLDIHNLVIPYCQDGKSIINALHKNHHFEI